MMLLFWKEWHETRLLPLLALATYISFLLGEASYERFDTGAWQQSPDLFIPLSVTWLIFWTVSGSCAISPEIGSGTLQFMSVIPIRRQTLWWVKLTVALCSAVGVFAITEGFMLLLKLLVFPHSSVGFPWDSHISWDAMTWFGVILGIVGLSLACIAFGLCASPLFDQPIVSTVVAAIGGAIYFQFWILNKWGPTHRYQGYAHHLAYILVVSILWITPPLVTSYQTFVRGESLKSIKRYKVGAVAFVGSSVVSTLIYALLARVYSSPWLIFWGRDPIGRVGMAVLHLLFRHRYDAICSPRYNRIISCKFLGRGKGPWVTHLRSDRNQMPAGIIVPSRHFWSIFGYVDRFISHLGTLVCADQQILSLPSVCRLRLIASQIEAHKSPLLLGILMC